MHLGLRLNRDSGSAVPGSHRIEAGDFVLVFSTVPGDSSLLSPLVETLDRWLHLWDVPHLQSRIEWSSRLTRSLGRCCPEKRLIRLASHRESAPDALLQEVLCHEMAHLAARELHGRNVRPRGPEWKALMTCRTGRLTIHRRGLYRAEGDLPSNLQRRLGTAARMPEGENLDGVVVDVQNGSRDSTEPGKDAPFSRSGIWRPFTLLPALGCSAIARRA